MRRRSLLAAACTALLPARTHARPPEIDVAASNAELFARLRAPGAPLRDWQWIVVHHTAAEWATLEGIDRYHRKRFGDPLGAEYHFVVNNGKKRPAGLVEAARWRYQELAAHLFKPENAPASIAICLIGNFEERPLPAPMLDALVDLTAALMRECSIPAERVSTHRVVDDKLTQCPGKHFPRAEYLRRIGAET
ncbi:peptidoglycan recognition protein family protein [Nannocystis pusilla]|uniref:peptidoglycan recognition protein family protein n=1 Tax=Nannocystis pusilla TaxID=889268 RepID=UPI003BF093C4